MKPLVSLLRRGTACLPPRRWFDLSSICGVGGPPENSREHARCKTSTFCLGEAAVGLIRLYLGSGESTAGVGEVLAEFEFRCQRFAPPRPRDLGELSDQFSDLAIYMWLFRECTTPIGS